MKEQAGETERGHVLVGLIAAKAGTDGRGGRLERTARLGRVAALVAVSLPLLPCAASGQAGSLIRVGRVRVTLIPMVDQAVADGRTEVLIRADCRETQGGRPVPDGTRVFFSTDLGDLSTDRARREPTLEVETRDGFAEVFATSDEVGTATITANVMDSHTYVVIDFVPEGTPTGGRADVVSVKGATVNYSMDYGVVDAWEARVRHRGLVVQAEHLMIDVNSEDLRARSVSLTMGDQALEGEDLYYSFPLRRGVLRRFSEEGGIERLTFSGATLKELSAEIWEPPPDPFSFEQGESAAWITAKSIQIVLRQKLILRNGALWVGDKKVMGLPRNYVIGMEGYSGSSSRLLTFDSEGSVSVDVPYFVTASSGELRSVRLQKGTQANTLVARKGWSLALVDEYEDTNSLGEASLSGLLQNDPDVQWNHFEVLDADSAANFYVASPGLRGVLTDAGYTHFRGGRRFYSRLSASVLGEGGAFATAESHLVGAAKPLGKTGLYRRLGTGLTFRTRDHRTGGSALEHEVNAGLSTRRLQLSDKLSLRPSLDGFFSWDTASHVREYARLQVAADYAFSPTQRLGLRYSLARQWDDRRRGSGLRQLLGFDYSLLAGRKWQAFINGTYDMTEQGLYAMGTVSYQFRPKYRFSVFGNMYDYGGVGFTDLDFTIWRSIGQRELGLQYSTADDRFSLQFAGATF